MVDAVTATTSAAAGRIGAGGAMLASNFETFLSLLTAQLKNQDPLSPVDSNQFTAQLTQMAGVEQQLLTNDLLKGLLEAQGGSGLTGAAAYIGRQATAAWAATKLEAGQANWSYELADPATSVTLEVLDGSGRTVWSGEAPHKTRGVHDFAWNGETAAGGQAADDGVYTLKITARTGAGAVVDSQVLTRGRVTGVELYDGQPYLTIGGAVLPMTSLIAVQEASANDLGLAGSRTAIGALASRINPLKLFS